MRLYELLSGTNHHQVIGDANIDISGLSYDSRKVKEGDLFFCIRGFNADGHSYAKNAWEAGAKAIVVDKLQPNIAITQLVVDNTREAMSKISSAFFGHPTKRLKLVGITGTNGKTTTAFMAERILRAGGLKTGLLGTVEYRIGDELVPVDRTTPESLDLQLLFYKMVQAGVEAAVIEVSSHAIDLLRVHACDFDAVVFTNLSQDHLDYHKDMGSYFLVKKKLFDPAIFRGATQVINVDDLYGGQLVNAAQSGQLRYSTKDKVELYSTEMQLRANGSSFKLNTPVGAVDVSLRLPGFYNIYNAMAASGATIAVGASLGSVKSGLEGLENVPGRFETVECGQGFTVVVDYAHTPDSLEKILTAARELTKGRLICVFGCGGDRDKGKRPIMGKVAAEIGDLTIITSDNPRSEEPAIIIDEIVAGVKEVAGASLKIEEDRRAAIWLALKSAQPGDFVVIAGKGHEQGQEIAGNKIPFDDAQVARELLRELIG